MENYKRVLISGMLLEMKPILNELDINYLMIGPITADTVLKKNDFEPAALKKKIHMTITCGDELKAEDFKTALIKTGKYSTTAQNANALFYKKGIELNVRHQSNAWSDDIQVKVNRNVCLLRSACFEKIDTMVDKIFHRTT